MTSVYPEYYILCEGYHDRAFWYGWLVANGWKGDRDGKDKRSRKFRHPGGYSSISPGSRIAYILPCEGWNNILANLELRYVSIR